MSIHSPHLLSSVETSVCHLAHQQADALLITSWIFCHNTIRSILCLKQNPAPPVRNSFFICFTLSSLFQDLQLLPFFPTSNPGLRFSTLLGKNLSYKWPNHMSYDTLNVKKTPYFYSFSENPFQTLPPGLFHPSINVICSNKFSCSFCPLLSLSLYTALSILWHPWLFFLLKNFIFTFSYLCVCDSMCVTVVRVL